MRGLIDNLARSLRFGAALVLAYVVLGLVAAFPSARAAQPEKTDVKIALASTTMTPGYPFLFVPKALGYWKDEGVNVEVLLTQGSTQVLQLLASGQADIGIVNAEPVVISDQMQHLGIVSVAAVCPIFGWSITVPEGSPIKSPKDLKGKTIGVFSLASGGIPYLKAKLKEAGLDPDTDVSMLPVGFGATAGQALKSGTVSALVLWTAAVVGLENSGLKLTKLPRSPWEEQLYSFVAVATQTTIKERPEMITRTLRGIAKGSDFTAARPEAATQAFWNLYPDVVNKTLPPEIAFRNDTRIVEGQLSDMGLESALYPKPPARLWGEQSADHWAALQDYLLKAGQVKERLDPTTYFTDAFTKAANDYDHRAVVQQAKDYEISVKTE